MGRGLSTGLDLGVARSSPLLLTLALLVTSCSSDTSPEPPAELASGARDLADSVLVEPEDDPPTPFDAGEAVFDTMEPPEQTVEFPPRPTPPPPAPLPVPPPTPAPTPQPVEGAGSCDIRGGESYCMSFSGQGWTSADARAVCDGAPDATFSAGACPLADRIATCAFVPPEGENREIVYTYYAPYDLALAELACPGTFTRIE